MANPSFAPYAGPGLEYRRCEDRIDFVSANGGPCGTMMVWPFVYNQFNCAPGLLWIAEAAGAPRALLLKAKRAVLAAGLRNPAQSAAVRRVFPWRFVEALLQGVAAPCTSAPGRLDRQAP